MLWVAECPSGITPAFLPWAAIESDAELEAAVRRRYALTGHNSILIRKLVRRTVVALLSALPPDVVRKLGLQPVASIDEGLQWLLDRFPSEFTYAVVPHANVMCATLDGAADGLTDASATLASSHRPG